jgi:hypothetical protein
MERGPPAQALISVTSETKRHFAVKLAAFSCAVLLQIRRPPKRLTMGGRSGARRSGLYPRGDQLTRAALAFQEPDPDPRPYASPMRRDHRARVLVQECQGSPPVSRGILELLANLTRSFVLPCHFNRSHEVSRA